MPVRRISELSPLGAVAQAFQETWAGGWPAPLHVAVMVGYLVVTTAAAGRLFRWE